MNNELTDLFKSWFILFINLYKSSGFMFWDIKPVRRPPATLGGGTFSFEVNSISSTGWIPVAL